MNFVLGLYNKFYGHAGGLVTPIDIKRLLRVLDKNGKVFKIVFIGGEPFLVPNFLTACLEITKKHHIGVFSNMTSALIKDFAQTIDPSRVNLFIASLHATELKRLGLKQRYVDNFLLLKGAGFNVEAQMVGYPPLLCDYAQYNGEFSRYGINIVWKPFLGSYGGRPYPQSYTSEELKIFGLDNEGLRRRFFHQGEICNAGYNVASVISNGWVKSCFLMDGVIGNIYKKIAFRDKLARCPAIMCGCPFFDEDNYLFNRAREETSG
jgi:MoaA/NifB/PqqE/SkfB family radical SAM enzyme